ncbi:hypothetical protein HPB48_024572 [Haemaphysalis longicornis]|uniref:CCHC-type domain-containing protein n=1 Tax=Haemaphysalis longicornis TaxID=44386 RepID=A0A9J6H9F2_HAELO|nr:hypothetical protein HPB48_024572 [Haemaphysalis longicornis]
MSQDRDGQSLIPSSPPLTLPTPGAVHIKIEPLEGPPLPPTPLTRFLYPEATTSNGNSPGQTLIQPGHVQLVPGSSPLPVSPCRFQEPYRPSSSRNSYALNVQHDGYHALQNSFEACAQLVKPKMEPSDPDDPLCAMPNEAHSCGGSVGEPEAVRTTTPNIGHIIGPEASAAGSAAAVNVGVPHYENSTLRTGSPPAAQMHEYGDDELSEALRQTRVRGGLLSTTQLPCESEENEYDGVFSHNSVNESTTNLSDLPRQPGEKENFGGYGRARLCVDSPRLRYCGNESECNQRSHSSFQNNLDINVFQSTAQRVECCERPTDSDRSALYSPRIIQKYFEENNEGCLRYSCQQGLRRPVSSVWQEVYESEGRRGFQVTSQNWQSAQLHQGTHNPYEHERNESSLPPEQNGLHRHLPEFSNPSETLERNRCLKASCWAQLRTDIGFNHEPFSPEHTEPSNSLQNQSEREFPCFIPDHRGLTQRKHSAFRHDNPRHTYRRWAEHRLNNTEDNKCPKTFDRNFILSHNIDYATRVPVLVQPKDNQSSVKIDPAYLFASIVKLLCEPPSHFRGIGNRRWLLNVHSIRSVIRLLFCERLCGIQVKVTVPDSFRKNCGIIKGVSETYGDGEILTCLNPQGVLHAQRAVIFDDDGTVGFTQTTTDKVLLTFEQSRQRPQKVQLGASWHTVSDFNDRPARCFKCQRLGHVSRHCLASLRCKQCCGHHDITDCQNGHQRRCCANCGGPHYPSYKGCPAYAKARRRANSFVLGRCGVVLEYAANVMISRELNGLKRFEMRNGLGTVDLPGALISESGVPLFSCSGTLGGSNEFFSKYPEMSLLKGLKFRAHTITKRVFLYKTICFTDLWRTVPHRHLNRPTHRVASNSV